jgi:hypothetical protein
MTLRSSIHRLILVTSVVGVGVVTTGVQLTVNQKEVSATAPPMYAYTSAHSGHWSHKINSATHSVETSLGDFSTNTNWRCSWNTNIVNNAATKVYQGRSCDGAITEIDVATNTFRNLGTTSRSNAMALSPDDRYLYTAEAYYINKWDLSTNPPTSAAGGSRDDNNAGINLGILPNGTKLYSPSIQGGKNKVQVFNTNLQVIATITHSLIVGPAWALSNPAGTEVWIGMGSSFVIVDTATDTISRTYTTAYGTGSLPSFNKDGSRLYLSSGPGLLEINTSDASVVRTIAGLGSGSHASISPDDSLVYVAYGQIQKWAKLSDGSTGSITLPTQTPNNDTPRTIVWAQGTNPPNISLSRSSATANIDNAVSGLYSISNTGGTATSYSISPSTLAAGLSFSTTTGLITGTPTATRAATTYTITATNRGGSSSGSFALTVTDPPDAPTPTFSSTTSTVVGFTFSITNFSNSYTYSVSATNGAIATHSAGEVTVTGLSASGTSTVTVTSARSGFRASSATASGRAQDATTTTTTVPAAANGLVSGGGNTDASIGGNMGSTTTVPSRVSTMATTTTVPSRVSTTTTTTTTIPAPDAPTANPGSGVLVIDGEETTASVTRTNNRVTVGAAGVSVTFNGIAQDGTIVPLDSEGNLRLTGGNSVSIEGAGFAANQDVEVWMFSTPQLLATVKADSNGKVVENIKLSSMLEEGNHRFVVDGTSAAGGDALVALGIIVGYESSGLSTTGKLLIALPIALAVLAGLIIPTTVRRRRRDQVA